MATPGRINMQDGQVVSAGPADYWGQFQAAPQGTAGPSRTSGGGGEDPQTVFMQLMAGRPITVETMRAIQPEYERRTGGTFVPNARGTAMDVVLPNGQFVDAVQAFEGPEAGRRLQWNVEPTFHDGQGGWYLPGGGAPGAGGGFPQGYSLQGPNRLSSFSAPGLAAPWTEQFQRPDPNSIKADPSYQFQMKEGMDAIQRSAAAKGTLLTGGTLKGLNEWAQGLASTFDDKYYNRAKGEYQMDQGTYWQNQNNAFSRLSGLANTGQQAASSYGANMGHLYTAGGNAEAQNTINQNQGWSNTFGGLAELGTAIARDRFGRPQAPTTQPTQQVNVPGYPGYFNLTG